MVAQVFQYGAALLLLPFIVTRLSPAEVGVWYVFVTVQSLALLADFGFQPTVARAFAAAFAGARELRSEGLAADEGAQAPNYSLAADVLRAAKRLYLGLGMTVLAVLLTAGLLYVRHISAGEVVDMRRVEIAWGVFAVGTASYLYLTWVSPFLLGSGLVTQNYLYVIASRGSFAVLAILALLAGGGLIALAAANLVANLVARIAAAWLMRPAARPLRAHGGSGSSGAVLRALWPNAGRMGLVALSGFLITRTNVLVLSGFEGLAPSASYAISLQILSALGIIAMLPTQIMLPRIVELRVRNDRVGLRQLLWGRVLFFLAAYTAGAVAFVALGQFAFRLIGSHVALLSWPVLALLAVVMLLESNHSNFAFVISTANRVPFVAPAIMSAAAIVLGSTGIAWAGWGALGVILVQGAVQAAYNNWKWPLVVWQDLHREHI